MRGKALTSLTRTSLFAALCAAALAAGCSAGADETNAGLLIGPGGILPLQMY